jgi:voltage-gated potassium channel
MQVADWEIRLARAFGWFGLRPVRNLLLYLVLVVLVSAAIYAIFEGREIRYSDGLWWAVVTLTTVGYGDIAPDSAGMRAVAVWVMASGLVCVAAITGVVAARLSVAALREADATPGIDDDFAVLAADLLDASARVRHLQERFRFDEQGDDRVSVVAQEVVDLHGRGALDDAAIARLRDAVVRLRATDA